MVLLEYQGPRAGVQTGAKHLLLFESEAYPAGECLETPYLRLEKGNPAYVLLRRRSRNSKLTYT